MMRGIHPEKLLEDAPQAVERDVEREERRRPDPEAAADPDQHACKDEVVDELVQERRMERVRGRVLGWSVIEVDLEAPGQVRRLAEELLVEPVAPATDALRDEEPRCDRSGEEAHALTGPTDDEAARKTAEQDPAPHSEASLPHRERPPPLVRHLVPARDVVVRPCADDPEGDPPD